MDAQKLYAGLDKDFILPGLSDEWERISKESLRDFYSDNWRNRFMGVVLDNTIEINRVYTAVFPSDAVLQRLFDSGEEDILLFLHHPMTWDIRKAPNIFTEISREQLKMLKKRRISIYALHVPLDNFGDYSTSGSLANKLELKALKPFAPYFGGLAGVFGNTKLRTVEELAKQFEKVVGHRVNLYRYGDSEIRNGKVAVVAGGGNDLTLIPEIDAEGVNVLVTGISSLNSHSRAAHDFLKAHKINLLGGTHYSTEKFACMNMCDYFKKLGLEAQFIDDEPIMEDM